MVVHEVTVFPLNVKGKTQAKPLEVLQLEGAVVAGAAVVATAPPVVAGVVAKYGVVAAPSEWQNVIYI